MMKSLIVVLLALASIAADPATKPSDDASAPSALEVRAYEEFNRANWSSALPLLKKVAQQMQESGQTQRLGSIEESIRVCEKSLKSGATGQAPASGNENRKPHTAPKPGETLEVSIKDLGNFDYDADNGGNIPEDVKRLSGATVRIAGFMIPMDQAENISQFALVPSLFACCFGQPPQVQHTIVVHVPKGKTVGYYPDEISVEGKLTVEEKKEDGFIVSIFEIECSTVKPAAK